MDYILPLQFIDDPLPMKLTFYIRSCYVVSCGIYHGELSVLEVVFVVADSE